MQDDTLGKEWWPKPKKMFPDRFCGSLGTEPGATNGIYRLEKRRLFPVLVTPTECNSAVLTRSEDGFWNQHLEINRTLLKAVRESRGASSKLYFVEQEIEQEGKTSRRKSDTFWFWEFIPT